MSRFEIWWSHETHEKNIKCHRMTLFMRSYIVVVCFWGEINCDQVNVVSTLSISITIHTAFPWESPPMNWTLQNATHAQCKIGKSFLFSYAKCFRLKCNWMGRQKLANKIIRNLSNGFAWNAAEHGCLGRLQLVLESCFAAKRAICIRKKKRPKWA